MFKATLLPAVLIASLWAAGPALSHPRVVTSSPAAGATVTPGPKELRIQFSEPLFRKFSGVTVTNHAGRGVKTAAVLVDPKDKRVMIVRLKGPLAPGHYHVAWHAVSADTHRVQGAYDFQVN
jgi:methionine-rich copper-binding protein CopC